MPKKKDSLIIGAVLLIAVVLFIVSRVMPKTDLNQKTADVTLAPDAVEYLDATPEASAEPTDSPKATPEPTAVPEETVPAEATAMPTAEASAPVEPTEAPQSANMMGPMPVPQTEEVKGHVIIRSADVNTATPSRWTGIKSSPSVRKTAKSTKSASRRTP